MLLDTAFFRELNLLFLTFFCAGCLCFGDEFALNFLAIALLPVFSAGVNVDFFASSEYFRPLRV